MNWREEIWKPYRDVIVFMVTLLVANYFWKFTVNGDAEGGPVDFFGLDITWPFDWLAQHIARVATVLIGCVRSTVYQYSDYCFAFANSTAKMSDDVAICIIWGCTGLKQSFIWLCLMLTARGSWERKLWFIPLGWLCIYLFNILRIVLIGLLIEFHPAMFAFWHEYVFKYLFYGMLFMLWVWWIEKIGMVRKEIPTENENNDKTQ